MGVSSSHYTVFPYLDLSPKPSRPPSPAKPEPSSPLVSPSHLLQQNRQSWNNCHRRHICIQFSESRRHFQSRHHRIPNPSQTKPKTASEASKVKTLIRTVVFPAVTLKPATLEPHQGALIRLSNHPFSIEPIISFLTNSSSIFLNIIYPNNFVRQSINSFSNNFTASTSSLCLSFSFFLLCLRVLLWCLLLCLVCMSLWSWCVRAVWCSTLKTPVCTFKTSPCVPAPHPHVVTLAGVVPAHTGTS